MLEDLGNVEREFTAFSHPVDLLTALMPFVDEIAAIASEAGPMPAFLAAGLKHHHMDASLM